MGCKLTPSISEAEGPTLLPDDIPARLQRFIVRARGMIVVFTCIITPLAASARVGPDVKRWSEKQCIYRQVIDECKRAGSHECSVESLEFKKESCTKIGR